MSKWPPVVRKLPSTITTYIKAKKVYFSIILISFLFLILSAPAYTASNAANYYVAPNGNDNNLGTINAPWRHIDYAVDNNIVKPGDVVYIRGGTYNEYINTKISGAPGNPITYQNYPGETPIITNSGSSGSWRWLILDQSHIHIKGMTFKNYQNGAIQVRAGYEDVSHVEITNCTFENQTSTNDERAVQITSSTSGYVVSNVVIQNNHFINIDSGIGPVLQTDGDVHNSKIIDNTIITASNIGIGIAGRPDKGQADNLLIKGNNVSDHGSPGRTSAGIYLDGAGSNIIVEENIVYNGIQGIKVALEPSAATMVTSRIIVRRNILYNNSQINLKLGAGETCNRSGDLKESVAVHNTIFSNVNNMTNVYFDCGRDLRWKNNIFAHLGPNDGFQYQLPDGNVNTSTWVMDNNWFLNSSGEGDHYKWDGRRYDMLSRFQTAVDQDINSNEGDPQFVDSGSFAFQLESNSPARDTDAPLTLTRSSGSGTVIPVDEAWYFSDGLGLQEGDLIRVGGLPSVRVTDVDYNNHRITVNTPIVWLADASVNYDYTGTGPDLGAYEIESVPALSLHATPQDGAVHLHWTTNFELPTTTVTWQIQYNGPAGNLSSPIENIPFNVQEYQITGLTNYTLYDITLSAFLDDQLILTTSTQAMPTDIFVYLPIARK
ncbi:MAG: hypothetical protein GY805_26475 [Chloroflexi bacterium]|nr:hypothetical protein [Chloroflexota bacterium]